MACLRFAHFAQQSLARRGAPAASVGQSVAHRIRPEVRELGYGPVMSQRKSSAVLVAIALFKLVKAITLIAVGIGALSLSHNDDAITSIRHVVRDLGLDPNHRLVDMALAKISGLDRSRLEGLSVGTFIYAAVFLVEGTGLILRKRWAEYLTVIVTASFIPFEIYEMAHKPSALKVVGIVVNVGIVIYLIVRLWRERRS